MPLPFPPPLFHAHIGLLLDLYVNLALRMLDAGRQLSALNLQLGRELVAATGDHTRRLMDSKPASQRGGAAQSARLQPASQLRH